MLQMLVRLLLDGPLIQVQIHLPVLLLSDLL